MRTLGIDARLYFQTGVGTYLRNLLTQLARQEHQDIDFRVFVLRSDVPDIRPENIPGEIVPTDARWHSLAEQTVFLYDLNAHPVDVMHFTYFSFPVLYRRPFLATVHDLTPLQFRTGKASRKHPIYYHLKHTVFSQVIRSQVYGARALITPTKTVRDELIRTFGPHVSERITPIYEGINEELLKSVPRRPENITDRPFFLTVGNFYPHKNITALIEAFRTVPEPFQLLLVGPDDYFAAGIRKQVESAQLSPRIQLLHGIDAGELAWLYRNAYLFVHPSCAEGFGLPLIEAAHFGTPIAASDIPVFRELLGDSFVRFDPGAGSDIARVLVSCAGKRPVSRKSDISGLFSFERMAQEHLALYRMAFS